MGNQPTSGNVSSGREVTSYGHRSHRTHQVNHCQHTENENSEQDNVYHGFLSDSQIQEYERSHHERNSCEDLVSSLEVSADKDDFSKKTVTRFCENKPSLLLQNTSPRYANRSNSNFSMTDNDNVPTVFRWEDGGRHVYITGTFNGWSRKIPMHRSGNDFTYIHNLKRGKHAYKFIVDDEWRFAPDQKTMADSNGRINNFVDVTDFKPYMGDKKFEREKVAVEYGSFYENTNNEWNHPCTKSTESVVNEEQKSRNVNTTDTSLQRYAIDQDGEVFGHLVPDVDEYTKDPPPLPPHLRHIILNKPPKISDTASLPLPQHVALNHLYCTAIKDNMMVLGITQRFKTKFVTTIYYSPCMN